ncbi:methyltransferase [Diaporthe amygdali]|uniref:methyltransferase n=1 Tax=Phomopsis amygdali TaxID=1214568 RepID=UPI0022FE04E3|nr:methyltransferase [Diaporthe amygdali]KAJ0115197.1 methyltransferase [Diaporthe amygdali]
MDNHALPLLKETANKIAYNASNLYAGYTKDDETTEAARLAMLDELMKLQQLTMRPEEVMSQMAMVHQQFASMHWLCHFRVPFHIPAQPSAIEYEEVASAANVPVTMLQAVARMAMTAGFLRETEQGELAHTSLSVLFADDGGDFRSWLIFTARRMLPASMKAVEATERWGDTRKVDETAYNLAAGTHLPFYEHINSSPEMAKEFEGYMKSRLVINPIITADELISNFDWARLGDGLVVDVGGGNGETAIRLAKALPQLSFVVQDVPHMVEVGKKAAANLPSAVASRLQFHVHDFFNEQPVKGASVYLMRGIMHNWPDEDAATILRNIVAIIRPGTSILMIDTVLLPPGAIPASIEGMQRENDMRMGHLMNTRERDLEAWQKLLHSAGLKIQSLTRPGRRQQSIVEAVLAGVDGSALRHED